MFYRATGSRPVTENIEYFGIAPAVVPMLISLFYLGFTCYWESAGDLGWAT
jgi:hypothetical protein